MKAICFFFLLAITAATQVVADDCYEFTGEVDSCITWTQSFCTGWCSDFGPLLGWHCDDRDTAIEPMNQEAEWDGTRSAEQGYYADGGWTVICAMSAECWCYDMNNNGTFETCATKISTTKVFDDEDVPSVNTDLPCPEVFEEPEMGGF